MVPRSIVCIFIRNINFTLTLLSKKKEQKNIFYFLCLTGKTYSYVSPDAIEKSRLHSSFRKRLVG
ncbi:hypothetical protein Lalb_Chr01g0021321 [Lupinus albus]|uniref:Uncharacterized protein n=1 Tax=Lupinus albus TaxID=3870 RepID=A0A6A4R7Y2_LUPAL|nr:hypothetical protein Lalb_Chr01g0021321 [Lupinus albus]